MIESGGTHPYNENPSEKDHFRTETPSSLFSGFEPIVRIKELPKKPVDAQSLGEAKAMMGELFGGSAANPILTQAFHAEQAVLIGAKRDGPNEDLEIITGGTTLTGEGADGKPESKITLDFPPGAKGSTVEQEQLEASLEGYRYWKRVTARRTPTKDINSPEAQMDNAQDVLSDGLSIEKVLSAVHRPFAWFVRAKPVPSQEIQKQAKEAEAAWEQNAKSSAHSIKRRNEARDQEALHSDLRAAEVQGLWEVDFLVGAQSENDVKRLAGQLAALSISSRKYTFIPEKEIHENLTDAATHTENQDAQSFHAPTNVVSRLFAYPKREAKGVSLRGRPEFDVNIEGSDDIPEGNRIVFGKILDNDNNSAGDLVLDKDNLTKHIGIFGTTGSGKSETIRALLTELSHQGITWTVLDPKGDYPQMGARLADADIPDKNKDVILVHPGDNDAIPIGFNPFEPEPGFPLDEHIEMAQTLIINAFTDSEGRADSDAQETSGRYLGYALQGNPVKEIESIYGTKGWDIVLGESRFAGGNPPYPDLPQVTEAAVDAVKQFNYKGEVGDNVPTYIESRFGSLQAGKSGEFFSGYPIDTKELFNSNTVIELDGVKSDKARSLIIGTTLVRMLEHLKVQERGRPESTANPLKHMIIIEEAQDFFKKGPLAEQINDILAKVRSLGVGIGIASQSPSALDRGAIGLTSTKVIGTLGEGEDRNAVSQSIGLSEKPIHKAHINELETGESLFFTRGMDHPVRGKTNWSPDLPTEKDKVVTPERILKSQEGREFYTKRERHKAQEMLKSTPEGRLITGWADLTLVNQAMGLGPLTPDEDWTSRHDIDTFDKLKSMDPRQRNCAIDMIVTDVVNTRSNIILNDMPRETVIEQIASEIKSHLDPTRPPIESKNLTLSAYKAMPAKLEIFNHLETQFPKQSMRYAEELDEVQNEAKILMQDQAVQDLINTFQQNSLPEGVTQLEFLEHIKNEMTEPLRADPQRQEVVSKLDNFVDAHKRSLELQKSIENVKKNIAPFPTVEDIEEKYEIKLKDENGKFIKHLNEQFPNVEYLEAKYGVTIEGDTANEQLASLDKYDGNMNPLLFASDGPSKNIIDAVTEGRMANKAIEADAIAQLRNEEPRAIQNWIDAIEQKCFFFFTISDSQRTFLKREYKRILDKFQNSYYLELKEKEDEEKRRSR